MPRKVYIYSHPYGVYGWDKWLAIGNICSLTELQKVPSYSRHDTSPDLYPILAYKHEQVPHICCHRPSALLPMDTSHNGLCTTPFFESTLTYAVSCSPASKAEVHGGCRISHFISFPPTTCWLVWHLFRPWIREMRAALSIHFFQATQDFILLYHILLQFICPAGRRLPVSVILPCMGAVSHLWSWPVTLFQTSSIPWANGRWGPGTVDTHTSL